MRLPFRCLAAALIAVGLFHPPARVVAAEQQAFVGMQVQGMSPAAAAAMGLEKSHGVLVRDIALGGPAAAAGFERGDLIVRFAGSDVDTFERLISLVRDLGAGEEAPVTVWRRGAMKELTLRAGKWPQSWRVTKNTFTAIPEVGLTIASLTPKVRQRFGLRWGSAGVVITIVDKDKAQPTDLKRGELIVQVNQQPVWKPKRVAAMIKQAKAEGRKSILLLVEGVQGFRFSLLTVKQTRRQ